MSCHTSLARRLRHNGIEMGFVYKVSMFGVWCFVFSVATFSFLFFRHFPITMIEIVFLLFFFFFNFDSLRTLKPTASVISILNISHHLYVYADGR